MTGLLVCCSCAVFSVLNPKMPQKAHLVILSDLADHVYESFIDVNALFGGRFDKSAAKLFCEVKTL